MSPNFPRGHSLQETRGGPNLKPLAVAAAIVASLTACSGIPGISSDSSTRPIANGSPVLSQPGTSAPDGDSSDSGDCLLGANGVDVQVGIANPTSSCASWIQNLAGIGLVWYPINQMVPPGSATTSDGETMQSACDLTDGAHELYVEDAGGQTYGDNICSAEEQNGWTPEASPGPLASQAEQQAQQQVQAEASESQASSNAAAEQQAQNDSSTLAEFSLSSDLSKLQVISPRRAMTWQPRGPLPLPGPMLMAGTATTWSPTSTMTRNRTSNTTPSRTSGTT